MSVSPSQSGGISSSTQFEPGLHPVPTDNKQVYGGGPVQSYPGVMSGYPGVEGQAVPAEKRCFGMRRSTMILSVVIFVLLAAIATIGGIFGSKIGKLESKLPSTATTLEEGSPTQAIPASGTTDIKIGGYSYHGCFADGIDRALHDTAHTTDTLTNRQCASFCSSFDFFGTENGSQCYCGNELAYESPVAPWHCSMHCKGATEGAENCGGYFYLSVWQKDE